LIVLFSPISNEIVSPAFLQVTVKICKFSGFQPGFPSGIFIKYLDDVGR